MPSTHLSLHYHIIFCTKAWIHQHGVNKFAWQEGYAAFYGEPVAIEQGKLAEKDADAAAVATDLGLIQSSDTSAIDAAICHSGTIGLCSQTWLWDHRLAS